jgi:hypothetical protein
VPCHGTVVARDDGIERLGKAFPSMSFPAKKEPENSKVVELLITPWRET